MELRKLFTNDIEMLELVSDFDVNSVIEKIKTSFEKNENNSSNTLSGKKYFALEDVSSITYNEGKVDSVTLFLKEEYYGIKLKIELDNYLYLEMLEIEKEIQQDAIHKIVDLYSDINKKKENKNLTQLRHYLQNAAKQFSGIETFRLDYYESDKESVITVYFKEGSNLRIV